MVREGLAAIRGQQVKLSKWDARIRRAEDLASRHSFAAEGLRFYQHVTGLQKSLYGTFSAEYGERKRDWPSGSLREEFDPFVLLPLFPSFLSQAAERAPAPLGQAARELRSSDATQWQETLEGFWLNPAAASSEEGSAQGLLAWIFLQPYAEYLADFTEHGPIHGTPLQCPLCSSRPLVGALRPEGDGGRRSMVCALCANEWEFRRILCPACGEEDEHKLAVYTSPAFSHVRVETCEICRTYIKTVDLTKDGHAVPAVDELAAIPLDLWATERGYKKVRTNLLGI